MSLEMRLDVELGRARSRAQRENEPSMRILIVADLMGASAEQAPPIDSRPIVPVSVDTFDQVFARFAPSVVLPAVGLHAPLAFAALDDFHPDHLFERVEIFERLRSLRQRLTNPSTFRAAADELRSGSPAQLPPPPADSSVAPHTVPADNGGALLDRLLGTKSQLSPVPGDTHTTRAESGVEAFVRSLVDPHVVAGDDPQLPQFLTAVDTAIADTMRSLLHEPAFQRVEATWRAVHWLLSRAGEVAEEALDISLLHLSREEISAEAETINALRVRLEERRIDATPWSLVLADFAFGPSPGDLTALQCLATLAGSLGIPLVAAARGALVGCHDLIAQADPKSWTPLLPDVAGVWADLRSLPESRLLGLTWPRILLRLPYGKKTDPIDAFEFEEIPTVHRHEDYLWGHGAFAAALTMMRTSLGANDGLEGDIGDLPAFTYSEDGEPTLKPCAEFCMTDRAVDEVLARGIIPLVSYRQRNAVRLIRVQSIGAAPFA